MKKILAILLAGMMTATALAGCGGSNGSSASEGSKAGESSAASNGNAANVNADGTLDPKMFGDETDIQLKVWAPDKAVTLMKKQVEDFQKLYPDVKFKGIEVVAQGESDAATQIVTDPTTAADVFGFPSDQFNKLINSKVLAPVNKALQTNIEATNVELTVNSAKVDDDLYAFPETNDNGYYLVYDKSVVSDEQAGKLEDVLKACKDAGKEFIMDCGNGFYACTFLFTGGVKIDGYEDDGETQKFTDYDEDKAVSTLMAFAKLMKDYKGTFTSLDPAQISSGFTNGTLGAGVDGTWNATADKKALGDNFAATKLPTINVDGTDEQMISMFGYKYIGVNSKSSFPRASQVLAYYLTSEKCQKERAVELGWGPSNTNAQADPDVAGDPILTAISEQAKNAVPQVNIAGTFWNAVGTLGSEMMKDTWDPSDAAKTKELLQNAIKDARDEA